jgi:hypothetical protein
MHFTCPGRARQQGLQGVQIVALYDQLPLSAGPQDSSVTGSSRRNGTSWWCLTTASLPIQFNVGIQVPSGVLVMMKKTGEMPSNALPFIYWDKNADEFNHCRTVPTVG